MNDEQKLAVTKMFNLLLALTVSAKFGEQSHKDIWEAAEVFGISKLALLTATIKEDS